MKPGTCFTVTNTTKNNLSKYDNIFIAISKGIFKPERKPLVAILCIQKTDVQPLF